MQRRNFILGLGTVATLSGAASVTGASLADSTEADADFRVIVDDAAIVASANDFEGEEEENLDEEDGLDFDELTTEDVPAATSTGDTDEGDLDIRLAFENGADESFGDSSSEGDGVFVIENEGDTTESIGIEIETYGEDVDDDNIEEADVDDAFEFDAEGDDISEEDTFVELEAGESVEVQINVEIDSDLESDIDDVAGDTDPFDNEEGAENVDLVDEIAIGTEA